ncbi:LytTR family DNA-binding domain-containing protein [Lutibacter sp. Hel_I_33_5]|uniref:LytTR family DNA-binding domain-containing protein n=1 Tax=Lutibacter sp. Hel_I_33_5 TaxID=1566289 RepID=UPI0011A70060|nr:LytTR family DNA-binding domain-containing protein [Lutibacter sp. Hel_I_33_5]
MKILIKWLNKPSFYQGTFKFLFIACITSAIYAGVFLMLFCELLYDCGPTSKVCLTVAWSTALISFLSFFITFFIGIYFEFDSFKKKNWTKGSVLKLILFNFIIIFVLGFGYNYYVQIFNENFLPYLRDLSICFISCTSLYFILDNHIQKIYLNKRTDRHLRIDNIKNTWLFEPGYRYNRQGNFRFYISFFYGLYIFLFFNLFKPYVLINNNENYFINTVFSGVIVFIVVYTTQLLIPKTALRKIDIIIYMVLLVFICSPIIFYGSLFLGIKTINVSLLEVIKFGFFGSFLPNLIFLVFDDYLKVKKINEKLISSIHLKKEAKDNIVTFLSNVAKDTFSKNVDDIIYIKSDGNYVILFYKQEDKILSKTIRISLKRITEQLKEYSAFFKCHKSYMVNSSFFNQVTGNSKALILHSDIVNEKIPVSRIFSKKQILDIISK